MEIFHYYSTINKYHNVKAESEIVPKGIMFHSTGENNSNLKRYVGPDDELLGKNQYNNHWNQPRPDGRQVCVHAFIGKLKDGSIATYQTLPRIHRGWHVGGDANNTHIGFEICEDNLLDKTYFNKFIKKRLNLLLIFVNNTNLPRKTSSGIKKVTKRKLLVTMGILVIGFQSMVSQWRRSGKM